MKKLRLPFLAPLFWGLVLLQVALSSSALAASPVHSAPLTNPDAANVQTFEDTLYATHYENEPIENRLSRLETTVFGQNSPAGASIGERISKLKTVLAPANTMTPLTAKPSNHTTAPASPATGASAPLASKPVNRNIFATGQNNTGHPVMSPPESASSVVAAPSTPAPGETDYPMVTKMEQRRFGKTFEREDITQRLARLEKDVFKVQQSGELVDRVDHLRSVIWENEENGAPVIGNTSDPGGNAPYNPPPIQWNPPSAANGGYYGDPSGNDPGNGYPGNPTYPNNASSYRSSAYSPVPSYGGYSSGNGYATSRAYSSTGAMNGGSNRTTPDMLSAMDEIEKQIIGHTYPSEPMSARLDRLESKVFNTTSPEMSSEDRMQRIIAVASAGGAPQSPQERAKSAFQTLLPIILTILPMILL